MDKDTQGIIADFQKLNAELEALKKSDPQKYVMVCGDVAEEINKLNTVLAKS